MAGYQGFGSFHSENVEDMILDATFEHTPPAEVAEAIAAERERSHLRHSIQDEFMLDPAWTFVNHGAFGAVASRPYAAAEAWRRHAERQPLRFVDRELMPALVAAIKAFAPTIGSQATNLVLQPNATTGLNAVLHSVALEPTDEILLFDVVYGSTRKIRRAAVERATRYGGRTVGGEGGEGIREVAVGDDPSRAVTLLRENLEEMGEVRRGFIKLAVLDHITSNTALLLPVRELTEVRVSFCALCANFALTLR